MESIETKQAFLKRLHNLYRFQDMGEEEMLQSLSHVLKELAKNEISLASFCAHQPEFPTLYQLAIRKRYPKLVKLLLQHGVNIDLIFNQKEHCGKLDSSLVLNFAYRELLDENIGVWGAKHCVELLSRPSITATNANKAEYYVSTLEPRFDFSILSGCGGHTSNSIMNRQTEQLGKLLRYKLIQTNILRHPFLQVFLHYKFRKFQFLVWFFILVQILKYAMFALFIFSSTGIQQRSSLWSKRNGTDHSNSSDNLIDTEDDNHTTTPPCDEPNNCSETKNLCFNIQDFHFCYSFLKLGLSVLVLLIVSIGKELYAFKAVWPRWTSYVTKFSNIQEWMVHFATITAYVLTRVDGGTEQDKKDNNMWNWALPVIIMTGEFTTLLLIQGQLRKVKPLSIYIGMFNTGFLNIIKFLIAFVPFLLGFLIMFQISQLPDNDFSFNWGLGLGKLLVMMTEGVDSRIVPENFLKDDQAMRNIVNVTIILFVVTVVILLQNLLVGIAVSDVQKLSQEAEVSYIVGTLENIVMLEAFLAMIMPWITKILKIVGFSNDKVVKAFTVGEHDLLSRRKSSGISTFMKIDEYPVDLRQTLVDWTLENMQSLQIYQETTSGVQAIKFNDMFKYFIPVNWNMDPYDLQTILFKLSFYNCAEV